MAELSITRRRFLKATGWTAAGVTVIYLGGRHLLSVTPSFDVPGDDAGAAWLQILPDGRCRMLCPRAEMGQHASIGLAQIAAEELNLAVEDIDLHFPNTHEIPQVVLTAGSMSMALFSEPMARAAAALREILRRRAAERAGVDLAAVEDGSGGFVLPEARSLSYADLAAGEAVVLDAGKVPEARLYSFDPSRLHRQVGRSAAPHELEPIVRGASVFASDVRLPEMLFGRTVRPAARSACRAWCRSWSTRSAISWVSSARRRAPWMRRSPRSRSRGSFQRRSTSERSTRRSTSTPHWLAGISSTLPSVIAPIPSPYGTSTCASTCSFNPMPCRSRGRRWRASATRTGESA
jgi:hypothetical protein